MSVKLTLAVQSHLSDLENDAFVDHDLVRLRIKFLKQLIFDNSDLSKYVEDDYLNTLWTRTVDNDSNSFRNNSQKTEQVTKSYFIENSRTKEKFKYTKPFVPSYGSVAYVLDVYCNLIKVANVFKFGEYEFIEAFSSDTFNVQYDI